MKKRIMSILLCTLMVFSFSANISAASTSLILKEDKIVKVEDEFTITLSLESDIDVYGIEADVVYDESVFTLESIEATFLEEWYSEEEIMEEGRVRVLGYDDTLALTTPMQKQDVYTLTFSVVENAQAQTSLISIQNMTIAKENGDKIINALAKDVTITIDGGTIHVPSIEVDVNTSLEDLFDKLPDEVEVSFQDGSSKIVKVNKEAYDVNDLDLNKAGTYTLSGESEKGQSFTIEVNVKALNSKEERPTTGDFTNVAGLLAMLLASAYVLSKTRKA